MKNVFSFDRDSANRNAVIASRTDRTGKLRTETVGRDDGALTVAVSTDTGNNSTRLFINFDGTYDNSVALSGAEARTLYRVLQKHFAASGKSW